MTRSTTIRAVRARRKRRRAVERWTKAVRYLTRSTNATWKASGFPVERSILIAYLREMAAQAYATHELPEVLR